MPDTPPAEETRADPAELSLLATEFLTASTELGTALQDAQADFYPPASAFGDTASAATAHQQTESLAEQVGTTVEVLKEVLEGDVDRLYRVAFAFQEADEASAGTIRAGQPL